MGFVKPFGAVTTLNRGSTRGTDYKRTCKNYSSENSLLAIGEPIVKEEVLYFVRSTRRRTSFARPDEAIDRSTVTTYKHETTVVASTIDYKEGTPKA
jgi:hypothetical protein